jgi:hypothetical protein
MKSSNQVKAISFFLVSLFIVLTFFVTNVNAAQVTWTLETVDAAAMVGLDTCIALDSLNRPHISYFDGYWKNLKYARWTGSAWSVEAVDTVDDVGYETSLALDSSDRPHISYTDWTNGKVKYARWTGSSWAIEVVDNAFTTDTSIALDSSDHAHICYVGRGDSFLKYARWTGSSWTIETVDNMANPGFFSLVLDSLGNPHISYNDETNRDLKYAVKTGSTWLIETVDSGGDVGRCNSIALDYSNRAHISYWDNTNNNLKYARWTGSVWSTETVDAADKVGQYSSIAIDSYGQPHISYTDHKWLDLKYAIGTVVGWFIRTVDTVGDVGYYTSIVLDSSDHAHISYYDNDNNNLKYARNPDETFKSWVLRTSDSDGDSNNDLVEVTFDVDTTFSGSLSVYVAMQLSQDISAWAYNFTTITITSTLPDSTTLTLMLPQDAPPGPYDLYVWVKDDSATIEDTLLFDAGILYPPQTSQVGYLTGTVTEEGTGNPLSAISVLINGDLRADTNSSGQYTIELPAGLYNVTFEDWSWFYNSINVEDVNIVGGSTTTLDVMLHLDVYVLELQVQGSGTLNPEVGNYQYSRESQVEVEVQATPDAGWIFSYWLLDSVNVGSENPFTVLMDLDHNLTAVFVEEPQVGFLAGQVRDVDTGLPIAEAEVSVNGTSKLTDPAGNFEFELEPGEYNITVGRLGYINETRMVTVTANVINKQEFVLQKTKWTLIIEIEGSGSTNPDAGEHEYSFGTEIVVEAFPSIGWNLGYWVFDSVWYGPEDSFYCVMDSNHELIVGFIEESAVEPVIESCSQDGGQKDTFNQGQDMYVTGGFFPSSETFGIYIVYDVETWTDEMVIPSRVLGTETTISSNVDGYIAPTNVWGNLETVGEYDIVIDVNDNGLYDVGIDALDDGDIKVTAGVEIIPEINSLTILILLMTATLLVIITKKKIKK